MSIYPSVSGSDEAAHLAIPAIYFEPMSQQIGIRDPRDDWTGLESAKERRKLQNRLNQRLYRTSNKVHPCVQDAMSHAVNRKTTRFSLEA